MAAKRKTLPSDFEKLLKEGDIDKLKEVFSRCETNARGGYSKQTALAFDECPHALATWLVGQGADLHARDRFGYTPLHSRSGSIRGNIKSLIELGADVNAKDGYGGTPLHSAANHHNVESTRILIEAGAIIDARDNSNMTPLGKALQTCRNIDIVKMAEITRLYVDAGITITAVMKELVIEVGKTFEFHRSNFALDMVDEVSHSLDELYRLINVTPVAKRILHDGMSVISVKSLTWQDQHEELWELLVPSSGAADTVQGEVIRISGRISNELLANAGANWDADFKRMSAAFVEYVQLGKSLGQTELEEVKSLIKNMDKRGDAPARMAELAVKWTLLNPGPIKLGKVSYKR